MVGQFGLAHHAQPPVDRERPGPLFGISLPAEHVNGASALETAIHTTYVEALTVDQPPLMQTARLEDYSPEFWAATAGKGAAVLHMLRGVMGDDNFFKLLKAFPEKYAWKSANTEISASWPRKFQGKALNWFFIQWIESSGAPEFKMEYTVFRTTKGFRVMGKIAQDLDTFRMPVDLRVETEGQSGGEEGGSGRHVFGVCGRDVRQAEEYRARSEGPGAALR